MKINYGLIIGAILFIFFMNHMLNNKGVPEVMEIPLEIRDEVEIGDIQKPIENIVPKVKKPDGENIFKC